MATAPRAARTDKAFESKTVHAYRRLPHTNVEGKELDVEVVAAGEKIKFRSNENGHIVGLVTTPAAFERLVKEIPEAYIEYTGEMPERRAPLEPQRPQGQFVLVNGEQSLVLDEMSDEEVREFATGTAGLDAEQLPEVLTGETLKRAVHNLLTA